MTAARAASAAAMSARFPARILAPPSTTSTRVRRTAAAMTATHNDTDPRSAPRTGRVPRYIRRPLIGFLTGTGPCLLYTSDAADDLLCVDLGGRRIIKKK